MTTTPLLEREMYTEAEAARLLRVHQGTLHYWLEGGTVRNVTYRPVLRPEPTGARTVTWAEFVEASLLRRYRRDHKIPLAEIRGFIDILREEFGIPYPLASERPWVAGQSLVTEAQTSSGLPEEFWLIAPARNQYLLLAPAEAYVQSLDFQDDVAVRMRPVSESPVTIDPDLRFGKPSVGGISTSILWEHFEDGYSASEVAQDFGLSKSEVNWAVSFETTLHAA